MARSYAQVHQRIWADPDWRALDVDAQHLYLLLISQPQMNLAGVLPLQLRKWSSCATGWTIAAVDEALDKLAAARFVVVDEETEEVLVRTLIRNDGAYRTPGMLKSILKFAEGVQSAAIRGSLSVELGRLPALEGKTAVENMALIVATRAALGGSDGPRGPGGEPIPDGMPDGIGDGIGDAFVGTHRGYLPQSTTEPIADTSVSVTGSVAGLSLVRSVVGGKPPAPADEPPKCKRHDGMAREDVPNCPPCGRLRQRWQDDRAAVAALIAAEASKPKPMCSEHPGQVATHCGPCRSEKIAKESA